MDTRTKVESTYNDLYKNLQAMYMAVKDADKSSIAQKSDAIIDSVLASGDVTTIDGFKNLLFGRYKEYVYETTNYPFFTDEDTYIMEELERIIKNRFGYDFFENHRLEQGHWMFCDGRYSFLFTADFVQTVY